MNMPRNKAKMSLERKERIMEAALGLFAEFGFHGVAVPKIADQASVATGSLYNYFSSKEALVNELYWFWKQKLRSMIVTDFPSGESAEVQFKSIWQSLYDFADKYPKSFQFIESHLHASYLTPKCLELEDELFEIGRQFVRHGQISASIKEAHPQLVVSMFFGTFVQYFKDSRAERLEWNFANSCKLRDICWQAMRL